jgi:hypothetical protein|nr:MAG TPA: hypothetical protein [Caudoviricetes sp.]
MKIIYVNGQCDFSAIDMEESGELKSLTKALVTANKLTNGLVNKIESSDESTVKLLEFGEVDKEFIKFVRDEIIDYDLAKQSDFYLLEEILPLEELNNE